MGVNGTRMEIRHYSDPDHAQFLELLAYPDHPAAQVKRAANRPLGLNHLGIQVADIDKVLKRVREYELGELFSGPTVLPEFHSNRYAFLKDPEGNLVEIFEPAQP